MQVLVINNDGGGFADHVEVAEGSTVAQMFARQMGAAEARHFLIRVNRQPELPTDMWQQCVLLVRKWKRANQRAWNSAAQCLRRDLLIAVEQLRDELVLFEQRLLPTSERPQPVSLRDIYQELAALRREFDDCSCHGKRKLISVTTERIELDGTDLGPFKIRLDWRELLEERPAYQVIALDPNPAACNSGVTHPHVQDDAVCEGEGQQPIRRALREVRLLDFFVIVANLLRTYNAESPYVALEDWYGVECTDCGRSADEDARWTCEACQTNVCGECVVNCADCDGGMCHDCVAPCGGCGEQHCNRCLGRCSHCREEHCESCLDDHERHCHEQSEQEDEDRVAGDSQLDAPSAPLHADGVGQAVVST